MPFGDGLGAALVSTFPSWICRNRLQRKDFQQSLRDFRSAVTEANVRTGREIDPGEPSSLTSSLLERLRNNSPEAWRRLVHLFGPLVYQWCRHRGLQTADAGDVGQEVFRAVAVNIVSFRRDRPGDTFRGWLWAITKSKLADHWRQRQNHPASPGGSAAEAYLANLEASQASLDHDPPPKTPGSLYQRALGLIQKEFQERTWKAFWRVAIDRCSPADVAAELGLSANAVYLAKSRVLRRLREELGELLE